MENTSEWIEKIFSAHFNNDFLSFETEIDIKNKMKTFTLIIKQQDINKARECFLAYNAVSAFSNLSENCIIAQAAKRQLDANIHGRFYSMGYTQMYIKMPPFYSIVIFNCNDPICDTITNIPTNELLNEHSKSVKEIEQELPICLTFTQQTT